MASERRELTFSPLRRQWLERFKVGAGHQIKSLKRCSAGGGSFAGTGLEILIIKLAGNGSGEGTERGRHVFECSGAS